VQDHVIGQAEAHRGFIWPVPLELHLQRVDVLQYGGQAVLTQDGDDGAPGLPGQFNLPDERLPS
jgi:hypothetical protein